MQKPKYTHNDLFFFVRRGNMERVASILWLHPELALAKNVWGFDAMYFAKQAGDSKMVSLLQRAMKPKKVPVAPKSRKGLPSLTQDDFRASLDEDPQDDDEDYHPLPEVQAEAELEDNLILMSSMFPSLSLSIIEVVLKRANNDVQASIDFLLAEDAQKPLAEEDANVLPLGSEEEFPSLASNAPGKLAQPSYQKPLKENLQQLAKPALPHAAAASTQEPVPKSDVDSWKSSEEGEEEEQWVDLEEQEEHEEFDFEDNVSFAESSGQEWDVVSQSSGSSFQFEPAEEAIIETREESGGSNQILDAEVEAPPSFADALKQNLSRSHVPLRPTNKSLLPKSSFVPSIGQNSQTSVESEDDEVIGKDPFRPFGSAQKPRKGGKSQYKPKVKGGKGKQSRNFL